MTMEEPALMAKILLVRLLVGLVCCSQLNALGYVSSVLACLSDISPVSHNGCHIGWPERCQLLQAADSLRRLS